MVFGFKWGSGAESPVGRSQALVISGVHAVSGRPMQEPPPEGMEEIWFGMGCFWGAERRMWQRAGVLARGVSAASS